MKHVLEKISGGNYKEQVSDVKMIGNVEKHVNSPTVSTQIGRQEIVFGSPTTSYSF